MKRADCSLKVWRSAAALCVLAGLTAPLPARAQAAEPLELTWRVPSNCPSAQQVRRRVSKLLGGQAANLTPLRAAATIARAPDGRLQLTLVTRLGDSLGERRVEGASCEDLTNAAAIHLALLLKAAGAPREISAPTPVQAAPVPQSQASDAAARAPTAAVSGESAAADLPLPAARSVAPRGVQLAAELPVALVELGPLPRPTLGLALGAGVGLAAWRLSLEGQLWLPQTLLPLEAAGPSAELERISAAVRGCRALSWLPGRFTLAPCVRVGFEHMWARGTGPHLAARTASASWLALGVGVQARLRLVSWFGLVAQLDGQLASARPRFSVSGAQDLGQRGLWAVGFGLGFLWIL